MIVYNNISALNLKKHKMDSDIASVLVNRIQ